MRIDNLQQYIRLQRELAQERVSLESRLRQIEEALGQSTSQSSASGNLQPGRRGRPPVSGKSLKSLVFEVLSSGPKTKEEILGAVQKLGYKFSTDNPLNSLGVILYGKNPKFNRVDGRFSLNGGGISPANPKNQKPAKRHFSPAVRKRIADAARKRWAAAKAAGKNRL